MAIGFLSHSWLKHRRDWRLGSNKIAQLIKMSEFLSPLVLAAWCGRNFLWKTYSKLLKYVQERKTKRAFKTLLLKQGIDRENYFSMGIGDSMLHYCVIQYATPSLPITFWMTILGIWPNIFVCVCPRELLAPALYLCLLHFTPAA